MDRTSDRTGRPSDCARADPAAAMQSGRNSREKLAATRSIRPAARYDARLQVAVAPRRWDPRPGGMPWSNSHGSPSRRSCGRSARRASRKPIELPARNRPGADLRTQGDTIKGRCQGNAPSPYRVSVDLRRRRRSPNADCSCPVGDGGHCKHVAALLLYYREHPDTFVEVEELDAALERRSKGELVALIRRMVRRVPELELLLDAPLPGYTDPAPPRTRSRTAARYGRRSATAGRPGPPRGSSPTNWRISSRPAMSSWKPGQHAAAGAVYRGGRRGSTGPV